MNKISKQKNLTKGIIFLAIFLIIGMLIYYIYTAIRAKQMGDLENPILIPGSVDASNPESRKSVALPITSNSNSPTMAFSLSFWMYVSDWYYRLNEPKCIMKKGREKGQGNSNDAPGIWLAPNKNDLLVSTAVIGSSIPQTCNIPNIPLQKWVHVVYVLDNRTNDVYINGKLERSCVLRDVPKLNNDNLIILPKTDSRRQSGFLGQLASVRYFSSALKPVDVVNIYTDGPLITQNQKATDETSVDSGEGGSCSVETSKKLGDLETQAQTLTDEIGSLQNDVSSDTCLPVPEPSSEIYNPPCKPVDYLCQELSSINYNKCGSPQTKDVWCRGI